MSRDSYNGHSFRFGAATSVYEARFEDHIIQTRYSHTSPKVIQHAQKQLAESDQSIV